MQHLAQFDRNRRTAADAMAQRRNAALLAFLPQGIDQRHDDARPGGTDQMPQRNGAVVDARLYRQ